MITFRELMVKADCGELDWLCCIGSYERLVEVASLVEGMDRSDLTYLWKMVCACDLRHKPEPGNGENKETPRPEPKDTCERLLLEWACEPEKRKKLETAKATLQKAIPIAMAFPAIGANVVLLFATIEAILDSCDDPTATKKAVAALCANWVGIEGLFNQLPPELQLLLGGVLRFIVGDLAAVVSECCHATLEEGGEDDSRFAASSTSTDGPLQSTGGRSVVSSTNYDQQSALRDTVR